MTISVTSEEFSQHRINLVDGRAVHSEDVTRVFIIEPIGYIDTRRQDRTWHVVGIWVLWILMLLLLL